MSLYEQWKDLLENQTEATLKEFWNEYSDAEVAIYTDILSDPKKAVSGTLAALAQQYKTTEVLFMGFLDGISTSLNNEMDVESLTSDSEISLDIDFEKLYFNMHKADAEHLYGIPEWDDILSAEKQEEIKTAYKKSKTIIKEKIPGRNDPCSCGSGKKYKKCCGKS